MIFFTLLETDQNSELLKSPNGTSGSKKNVSFTNKDENDDNGTSAIT